MICSYKLLLSDLPRQVYIIKDESEYNISEEPKFSTNLQNYGLFQMCLIKELINLPIAVQNFDNNKIEYIFQNIIQHFIYDPDLIYIFKDYDFPKILIDLLQYEQWRNNYLAVSMLSYLVYCSDEEVLVFLLQNNLIQIINSCIVANNTTTIPALLCLGNFIIETKNRYQSLICNQISINSIWPLLCSDDSKSVLAVLFFINNLIQHFHFIPNPDQLVNSLKQSLSPGRMCEGMISFIIECFIQMVQIDNSILIPIFHNFNMFPILYSIYIYKDLSTDLKKKVISLFIKINNIIDFLMENYPEQNDEFLQMKKIMLTNTFDTSASLLITLKSKNTICISGCLLLLESSIRLFHNGTLGTEEQCKDIRSIIKTSIKLYQNESYGSFKLKYPSLNLLMTIIRVFNGNLDLLRFMREKNIDDILVESLSLDKCIELKNILKSIIIIVDAFQQTVESVQVKKEFDSLNLDSALDDLNFLDDRDEELYNLIELVRRNVCLKRKLQYT